MGFVETLDYISIGITVFAAGLLAFQAVGQLMKRPLTTNRIIVAVLFLGLAIIFFTLGLGIDRWPRFALPIYGLQIPLNYLVAPLFRAYYLGVVRNQPGLRFPGYLYLLPFFIAMAICLPIYFFPPDLKYPFMLRTVENPQLMMYRHVIDVVVYGGLLSILYSSAHMVYELRILKLISAGGDTPVLWHFRLLLLWIVVAMTLAIVSQYVDSISMKRMVIAMIASAILWFYLLDFRYARFFHRLDQEIRTNTERYRKSKIEGMDVQAMIRKLDEVMVRDNLYADEDLTRAKLAGAVDIHPNQLSELLSSVMGTDFRHYVGRHRLEAAKRMLIEQPERSVLSIGLAAGFNSKSSFNRNFKAETGKTPQEFRAAQGAEEPD